MPFSINDFKAILNSNTYGGPARTNLFEVIISGGSSQYMSQFDLTLFCKTATIPGLHVDTFEYKQNNYGLSQEMPVDILHENMDCIFFMDSNHKVLSYFHEWMQKIVNYSTQGGPFSEVNGMLPYEIGYKEEYAKTMIIRHYTSDNMGAYYETVIRGVYPITIGQVLLSWEENTQLATLPVKFGYSSIQFSGELCGVVGDRFSRGTGYLGLLNYIGGATQFINQNQLPIAVQDAINVYTKVTKVFNALKSVLK